MKNVGIFEAKNRLSELCEEVVRQGDPIVVTRHGKPMVCIVPHEAASSAQSVWDSVEECRAKYGPLEDGLELPDREVKMNRTDPLT